MTNGVAIGDPIKKGTIMKRLVVGSVVGLFAIVLLGRGQEGVKKAPELEAIGTAFRDYSAAFNKHDAKTASEFWTTDCVYVDRDTGERVEGRPAMLADFEKMFAKDKGVRIVAQIERVRLVRPDVASIEGRVTVTRTAEEPNVSQFTGIAIKDGERWLFSSIDEMTLPKPATSKDALRELEWLVGSWVDQSAEIEVKTTFRWSANHAFLIRSYQTKTKDGAESEGNQIIAWDPRHRQIRSWSFNSDSSFGDAIWSKSASEWLVKSEQTLSDGRSATGTYVLTKTNNDAFSVKLVGHEIDGEPQPAGKAVSVVRAKDDDKK